MPERSIDFDRAAEYYDATRGSRPMGSAPRPTRWAERGCLRGRVGSHPRDRRRYRPGRSALHERGVPLAGIDLSGPMLDKLVEKGNGVPPFPLVEGDATRMPFPDDAFAGTFLRWVLHLIPDWRAAVREIVA